MIILAAGDSSRLGLNGPKGLYHMDLPSNPSFFQVFIERIKYLCLLAREKYPDIKTDKGDHLITIYIVISDTHRELIEDELKKEDYYNYPRIRFYEASTRVNIFSGKGKIPLKAKGKVMRSSFGNGLFINILKERMYADTVDDGVEYIHLQPIDNLLCKPADPFFTGHIIQQEKDLIFKTVLKTNPMENVGIHVKTKKGFEVYG